VATVMFSFLGKSHSIAVVSHKGIYYGKERHSSIHSSCHKYLKLNRQEMIARQQEKLKELEDIYSRNVKNLERREYLAIKYPKQKELHEKRMEGIQHQINMRLLIYTNQKGERQYLQYYNHCQVMVYC